MARTRHVPGRGKRILRMVADEVASVFPYVLAFYILSLVLSVFFESWRLFFWWPAFHTSVLLFAVMSLWSGKADELREEAIGALKRRGVVLAWQAHRARSAQVRAMDAVVATAAIAAAAARIGASVLLSFLKRVLAFAKRTKRVDRIRSATIAAVVLFALWQGTDFWSFCILFFGLVSVLFVWDMRIAAGGALFFLALAPFLLMFGANAAAEAVAVYAYYFLVIAVATAIAEEAFHPGPNRQSIDESTV